MKTTEERPPDFRDSEDSASHALPTTLAVTCARRHVLWKYVRPSVHAHRKPKSPFAAAQLGRDLLP